MCNYSTVTLVRERDYYAVYEGEALIHAGDRQVDRSFYLNVLKALEAAGYDLESDGRTMRVARR